VPCIHPARHIDVFDQCPIIDLFFSLDHAISSCLKGCITNGTELAMISIVIHSDADFTPKGKRIARYVKTNRGTQLRWYVGGRLYLKGANPALTSEWLAGENGPNHVPQSWESFY